MGVSTRSSEAVQSDEKEERARRAERLAKMFARWAEQDVSDEPEWDIADIEPIRFRVPVLDVEADEDEGGT